MASSIRWAACRFFRRRREIPLHRLGQFQNSALQTVEIEIRESIRAAPIDDFIKMQKFLLVVSHRLIHFVPPITGSPGPAILSRFLSERQGSRDLQ
jgi:hypothetical protein